MIHIEWSSAESHILCNPRLTDADHKLAHQLQESFSNLKGHIWIATSGSTGDGKWAALSKQAILSSAKAVNQHLQCEASDCWIHSLPDWHVGGIGIWARSYLSGAKVIDYKAFHEKWNAQLFCKVAEENKATLSALVPAQIYDLVTAKLPSPASIRAVIVGGGALEETLYHQAVALGWKLLPSYGLTEACSQVATAALGSWKEPQYPNLVCLSHVEVIIREQCICIRGPSLLSGYGLYTSKKPTFIDPKSDGWLQTDDLGKLIGNRLTMLGRLGDIVKVGGENVDLHRLNQIMNKIKLQHNIGIDTAIVAVPDQRLGNTVNLVATSQLSDSVIDQFHENVLPFERIRKIHLVEAIPRTSLGKLRRNELLSLTQL